MWERDGFRHMTFKIMQNEMVRDPNEFKKRVSELPQEEIRINESAAHMGPNRK